MSEWIEKEEVLKQIDCWLMTGEYKYSNATHYLDKRISSIKPKESKWISVNEKLPKPFKSVLVYDAFEENITPGLYGNGDWLFSKHVTHWMPLPEKPESDDTEYDRVGDDAESEVDT